MGGVVLRWGTVRTIALVSAALLVCLAGAVPATATVDSVERSISEETVESGQTVTITVSVQVGEEGSRLTVEEFFDDSFESATEGTVTYNGDAVPPNASFVNETEGVLIALEPPDGFAAGDTVTVSYEVTVPSSASEGQSFQVDGESAIDDQSPVRHAGDTEISVASEGDGSGGSDNGGSDEPDDGGGGGTAGGDDNTTSATPTPTATPTPIPTPTATPTATPTTGTASAVTPTAAPSGTPTTTPTAGGQSDGGSQLGSLSIIIAAVGIVVIAVLLMAAAYGSRRR
jgi:cell division septation protein DedD